MGEQHWLFFGDGNVAQYQKKKIITRPDGTKYVRFIIQPSSSIVAQYNLVDDDPYYASTGLTIREYHNSQVITIMDQAGFSKIWVLTGFDDSETPASSHFQHLTENILNLEKTLKSIKVANVRAHQEFRKMVNQQKQHVKENIDLVNEARKGSQQMGSMVQGPEMMDDQMGQ